MLEQKWFHGQINLKNTRLNEIIKLSLVLDLLLTAIELVKFKKGI